jgi:hypothetical protein
MEGSWKMNFKYNMSKIFSSDTLISILRFLLILVAFVVGIFIITRIVLWYHS